MLYFGKIKIGFLIRYALFAGLFLLFGNYAQAADLSLSPSTGSYSVGQTFTVNVQAVPNGDNINAVESTLSYDPSLLSVVSVSKNGSAFSLWTTEPIFSNADGTVKFGGGSPTPFTTTSKLLSITFRAVAPGTASVTFKNSSVLAADGRGTDVYKSATNGSYTITTAATPKPTPTPSPTPSNPPSDSSQGDDKEAIVFGDPPLAPEVGSKTFLDPEVWYAKKEGVFKWKLPYDADAVAVEITTNKENVPYEHEDSIIKPPVDKFEVSAENVIDGEQYISVAFHNQVGWGAVTNRKLRIDTIPPEPFAIKVIQGVKENSFPTVRFEAKDKTSGIERYEMTIADREPIVVTPDEAKLGYLLKELEDGTYTVKVVAYDKAGNSRESSVAVLITAGWTKPVEEVKQTSFWDFLTPINLFIAFLIIIIILQIIYFWYEHKRQKEREQKLIRETREIQDQMEKIFSALRDEIYDQINSITKRKRLSAKEKEAVEALTQALEVSETLIEKEINDVNTILK